MPDTTNSARELDEVKRQIDKMTAQQIRQISGMSPKWGEVTRALLRAIATTAELFGLADQFNSPVKLGQFLQEIRGSEEERTVWKLTAPGRRSIAGIPGLIAQYPYRQWTFGVFPGTPIFVYSDRLTALYYRGILAGHTSKVAAYKAQALFPLPDGTPMLDFEDVTPNRRKDKMNALQYHVVDYWMGRIRPDGHLVHLYNPPAATMGALAIKLEERII